MEIPAKPNEHAKGARPSDPVPEPESSTVAEVATNAGAAALSLIPVVGAFFAQALSGYSSHKMEEKLKSFIRSVEKALNRRVSELEELEGNRQEQVVRILREVQLTLDEEKLDRLRNALVNIITTDIERAWSDALRECVVQVSSDDVKLLKSLYAIPEKEKEANGTRRFISLDRVQKDAKLPNDLIRNMLTRVIRLGLVEEVGMGVIGVEPLQYLDRTELGRRFLKFIAPRASSS